MHFARSLSVLIGLAVWAVVQPARSHIRLEFPTTRYPIPPTEDSSKLKEAPCGVTGDTRTKDPARISTFAPGQMITLKFRETINHPGHYRIAFDQDGQDAFKEPASYTDIQTNPVLPILLDGIADKAGGEYQVPITLPSVECNNCTLQLIQVMTDKAPYVINTDDVYHQCADIVLSNAAVAVDGGGGSAVDAGSGAAGGSVGGTGGTSGGSDINAAGGGSAGSDGIAQPGAADAASGCSCRIGKDSLGGSLGASLFAMLGFCALGCRRRRR